MARSSKRTKNVRKRPPPSSADTANAATEAALQLAARAADEARSRYLTALDAADQALADLFNARPNHLSRRAERWKFLMFRNSATMQIPLPVMDCPEDATTIAIIAEETVRALIAEARIRAPRTSSWSARAAMPEETETDVIARVLTERGFSKYSAAVAAYRLKADDVADSAERKRLSRRAKKDSQTRSAEAKRRDRELLDGIHQCIDDLRADAPMSREVDARVRDLLARYPLPEK